MRIVSPSRRASILTAFAILFLAFTVFGWGIGYKLSLYLPAGSPARAMAAAKLLSEKERPAATQAAEKAVPAPPADLSATRSSVTLVFALLLGLRGVLSARVRAVRTDDVPKDAAAHSTFFSFRPPPTLLLCN
jgi:hypothetical protein